MYRIDESQNKITRLEEKTFSDLGFREREHLQEWIADYPMCLGEELLIIQKEFDGFHDTRERLDLLALDKQGNLVIIENKLDDSGRDVTWQVLKYASYCSTLSKDDIRNIYQSFLSKNVEKGAAEERIAEFLEKEDYEEVQINQGAAQRIIMIAANFRKEVTSTVIWLMNFNIRMQCFKVTPFSMGEYLFLNFDQILPVKDAEEFTISMASKAQDEIATQENLKQRHHLRLEFWEEFLKAENELNNHFSNVSPSKDNWLATGIGMSGIVIVVKVTKSFCRTELNISRGDKDDNKMCFDFFYSMKDGIEEKFGGRLIWARMDDNVSSRIEIQMDDVSYADQDDWDKIILFLVDTSNRMYEAFKSPVATLNQKIRNKEI